MRVRANARTEQAGRQTAKADRNIQQTNIFIGKRKIKESKKINRFHGKYIHKRTNGRKYIALRHAA